MAININDRKLDLAFKKLVARQYSAPNKQFFEEKSTSPFTLTSTDVWVEDIPSNPLDAITNLNLDGHPIAEGVVKEDANGKYAEGKQYILFKDTSTEAPYAWYIYENDDPKDGKGKRLNGFISDQFGEGYAAKLLINDEPTPTTDPCGWLFDYATGTVTFLNNPPTGVMKIQAYRYIGRTVKDAVGETFDEDLGNLIIQPNKTINLVADQDAWYKLHPELKPVTPPQTDPSQQQPDPNQGTDPSQGTDSNQGTDPSQGTDPNQGTDPSQGTDPNQGTDPSQQQPSV